MTAGRALPQDGHHEAATRRVLSEQDLDLRKLSDEELSACWLLWLQLAQTNDLDEGACEHGVFRWDPAVKPRPDRP